MGKKEYHIIL